MQNYTLNFFILDSTGNEASVMDHDAYDFDGCSAEVKSVITQVLQEKKTGAPQQYDPLSMLPLPEIPGNILIQLILSFVLFC